MNIVKGDAEVTPYIIKTSDLVTANPTFETAYGSTTKTVGSGIRTDIKVNGDSFSDVVKTTTGAYTYDEAGAVTGTANVVRDKDRKATAAYSITDQLINSNYAFDEAGAKSKTYENTATVTPAGLTANIGNVSTEYGTAFKANEYKYTLTKVVAQDNQSDVEKQLGELTYTNAGALQDDGTGRVTKKVGHYDLTGTQQNLLQNYDVNIVKGDAEVTPYTIKTSDYVDNIPTFTTQYGDTTTKVKNAIKGVNGDGVIKSTSTTNAYTEDGKRTQDAGDHVYDITTTLNDSNYQFGTDTEGNAVTSNTYENTASVTKADLNVTTANVSTTYGTVNTNYQTSHSALVNGDTDNLTYTYDDHGAYRDNYTYTNNVGNYALDTTANGDLLKNYNVTTNTANIEIGIKDITLNLTGTGSTTTNATITEGTPSYAAQLVNGDTTANAPQVSYSVGTLSSGNNYSIIVDVNGNPIATGDVVGNYRFNYSGVATITPPADRVKLDYRDTANLAGTGLYALDGGTNVVPGVSKVLGLTDAQLPFFKVAGGQVSNYGTYEVTETPTEVKVTPTAKHIPEPNKEKNQYRALNKTYELSNGTGAFNLVYDGTTFNIYPTDAKAKSLLKAGDPQHNVEVEAKALFSSFNEMGIVLEDLDAVYVHTDATEDETKNKEKA